MPEATIVQSGEMIDWTADGTYARGTVIQLRDGRAAVTAEDMVSGETKGVYVCGIFECAKTTSMVMLIGSQLFWDYSANKAHLLHGGDRDFLLGTAEEDATSAATTVRVNLNKQPVYSASLGQGFETKIVQTAGFPYAGGCGQGAHAAFSATAEVQKSDALGIRGVVPAAIAIVDCLINIVTAPDNAAVDINVGIANATHASDADSITESLFIHIDGNSANINAESDDGATEVASTDTTDDYAANTPFLVQWDLRNTSDIQLYINGVNRLPSSVFKLNAATGPLKPLLHIEKTSDDSPGAVFASIGIRGAQV